LKIVVETSALVSASICWRYIEQGKNLSLEHHFYRKCCALIEFCKTSNLSDNVIITKTIEEEAKSTLKKAARDAIRDNATQDLVSKYGFMVLQHIVYNSALDKLDYYVEECSVRTRIDRKERELVIKNELEPFLVNAIVGTNRFIRPILPRFIGKSLRNELITTIVQSLPTKGIIYKGMPEEKDLRIMAEATMVYRKYGCKEKVYVASVDNHFKPNPVLVAYYQKPPKFIGQFDSTVRDKLAGKFGFIGEDPKQLLYLLTKEIQDYETRTKQDHESPVQPL
jgi:hypothetical protein